ncbi:MAG: hypothetical protein ACE5J7_02000 [Candidatus Aenigmatarchaeota archaeon]
MNNNKIISELKKKYSVNSLEEFSQHVKEGRIGPKFPGDFEYEDDYFLWRDIEYEKRKEKGSV